VLAEEPPQRLVFGSRTTAEPRHGVSMRQWPPGALRRREAGTTRGPAARQGAR
jgi:hypothetical protein